jgi:hypothetical protein
MTVIDADTGLFAGMSPDDKADAVLQSLSVDAEVTLQDIMRASGLTASQVHAGIRHLREARGEQCVLTHRRGAKSTYRLAENAPEVRDYANRRMRHWRCQIRVLQAEMDTAMRLLPEGHVKKVLTASAILNTLLLTLELNDAMDKDLERRELALERKVASLNKKRRVPVRAG